MRILLVDDDIFLRDMYATKFTESGDTVVTAQSGQEALQKIESDTFDVVIMDMVMPAMTGLELLQALKDLPTAATMKKIVLSNQGEESDIQAANKLGADGYIIKAACIPSEVVTKVHALLA
jgi:CheY-like chemotaxis protein